MFKIRYLLNSLKIIATILLIYSEFLCFLILPLQWPKQQSCIEPDCVKILLVADPQILGVQDSAGIARWDADRYLRRTFQSALLYIHPDLIIFLGDLMDEGHISDDDQFTVQYERFHSIFNIPKELTSATTLYVPGDNDIGGEEDPIIPQTVRRFDRLFDQSAGPITFGSMEVYRVNRMTSAFDEPGEIHDDVIRVALSHVPLMKRIYSLTTSAINSIKPHVIFSGHNHDSVHLLAQIDDIWRRKVEMIRPDNDEWLQYKLDFDIVHEFIVPTCSYRMGVPDMGFGAAYLDIPSRKITYTVLWLPRRLKQLAAYLYFIIGTSIIFLCLFVAFIMRRIRRLMQSIHGRLLAARHKSMA